MTCAHCGEPLVTMTDEDGRKKCVQCRDYVGTPARCPVCRCPGACIGHFGPEQRKGQRVWCQCDAVTEGVTR